MRPHSAALPLAAKRLRAAMASYAASHAPAEPQEGALATEAQQQAEAQAASMESLREFTRDTAVLLLFYTIVRSAWHLGVPAYFGGECRVPPLLPPLPAACSAACLPRLACLPCPHLAAPLPSPYRPCSATLCAADG